MKSLTLLLLTTLFGLSSVDSHGSQKTVMPVAGLNLPVAAAGDEWNPGLSLGIHFPLRNARHGNWSIVTSYQQMSPNAEEMLKTGGRKMKIEKSEGVSRVIELGILGDRKLWSATRPELALSIQYGASVYLVDDDDIHVKGAYLTPSLALTKEIYRVGETLVVPGISLGFSLDFLKSTTLCFRMQHLFTAESSRDLFFMGIGFQPS